MTEIDLTLSEGKLLLAALQLAAQKKKAYQPLYKKFQTAMNPPAPAK